MQVIVFQLGQERFGLNLQRMKEIIRDMVITAVPGAPDYFEGVTNLRGKILPIINLKRRLGMEGGDEANDRRIIVLEDQGELIGYQVDRVVQVIRIQKEQIMAYDGKSTFMRSDCIKGILRMDTGIIILLELDPLHEMATNL